MGVGAIVAVNLNASCRTDKAEYLVSINGVAALGQFKVDTLEVLVDDAGARENVTRFAESRGYKVACTEDNGDYRLVLSK